IYYNKVRFEVLEHGNRWFSFKGLKEHALTSIIEKGIAEIADGAVVGSAIVSEQAAGKSVEEVLAFVKSLADGAHAA
ncbi:MAG: hypothetical protein ACPG5U_04660, partial [Planktomarina sp.]